MVNSIIEKHITTYFLINQENGKAKIFLYLPYLPYKDAGKNYAVLDAYYVASNTLYNIIKNKLLPNLKDYNPKIEKGNLKRMFRDAGIGFYVYNSLLCIPPNGTRTALAIIEIDGAHKEKLPITTYGEKNACKSCTLCSASCPTGALEGGFVLEKCLRQSMNMYAGSNAPFEYLEGRILGCDICQKVCPYNHRVSSIDMPKELLEQLELKTLLHNVQLGKKGLSVLAGYIGENYARPRRLAFFALNAIRQKEDAYLALPFLASNDPLLARKAGEVINRFSL